MELDDGDGLARSAVGSLRERRAGEADEGGDAVCMRACEGVAHESAVRMPDERDPFRIDVELAFDLVDDADEVAHVVDAGSIEVTTGVRRIPEAVAVIAERAIRRRVQISAVRRQVAQAKVVVVFASRRAVPMEHDQQGSRMVVSVRRRHAHRDRPVAANSDVESDGAGDCVGVGTLVGTGLPEPGAGAPEHATTRIADNAKTANAFMGSILTPSLFVRLYLSRINVASSETGGPGFGG